MNIGDIWFGFRGSDDGLVVDAKKSGAKAGAAAGKSFEYKLGESMRDGLGIGAGIGAFNLLSTAIGGTVDFLGDAVKAGMEEEQSISKMTASLKANVPAWDGRTDAIEKVLKAQIDLGFSDDEQRNSMSLLVAATHDVNEALSIQRTAMDLARFKGISLADATDALTKVEAGSYRILKGLGIVLKDGATQTEALAAVQAVAEGQAAKFAETTGGKLLVAQTKFGEKMDDLGTTILPIVSGAIDLVTGGTDLLIKSLGIIIPPMRDFDDAAGAVPLTLENNANAANVLAATWGTLGTSVWVAGDKIETKNADIASSSEREARRVKSAIGSINARVAEHVTITGKATNALAWDWKTYADYLLGGLTSNFDRAMSIQEARADLHAAKTDQDHVEAMLRLAELGALSEKEMDELGVTLRGMAKDTKGAVHTAIDAAIVDYNRLRAAAKSPITVKVNYLGSGKVAGMGTSATGGYESGLTWVGEKGPELVALPPRSYVYTAAESLVMRPEGAGSVGVGSGGFSPTINVYNPEPRAAEPDIGRVLRRTAALGMR